MKNGIVIMLFLLLTAAWMAGCNVVGDNEPEPARESIESIHSTIRNFPSSPGSLPEAFPTGYVTAAGDTTGMGD